MVTAGTHFSEEQREIKPFVGKGHSKDDPKFVAWDEQDLKVTSWLWNSMLPEISDMGMFLGSDKEIWDAIQQTYSKVHDAAQIYEIKTNFSSQARSLNCH